MTPADAANEALNETLAAIQLLLKCCMMLQQDDPDALKILDEIARCVAKDLKLYRGIATSFSPQLLSCAAVVQDCSKGGVFVTLPDWMSVTDKDLRIKGHPRFNKMALYRPCPSVEIPVFVGTDARVSRSGTSAAVSFTMQPIVAPSTPAPPPEDFGNHAAPATELSPLSPSPISEPLEPLAPIISAPILLKYNLFVLGTKKNAVQVMEKVGNSRKRHAEDDDPEEVKSVDMTHSDPQSRKSVPKRNRLMSSDEENVQTKPGFVTKIIGSSKIAPSPLIIEEHPAPARSNCSEGTDDRGFWDAENRPVEWGRDSAIATAVEYSVRHHTQKCDKCNKLDVACLVLLDKKFGCIRLDCANCDEMKITCAINGIGVQERMQAKAKAKAKAGEDSSNPVRRSKSRVPKSRVVNKTLVNTRSRKMPIQPASSSSPDQHNIIEQGDSAPHDQVVSTDVTPARTEVEPMRTIGLSVPIVEAAWAVDPADPKPTARDILHSIQDLGRRLDLLATNERVDQLDARLGSVEDIFGQRLNALEQHLNSSDAERRATSSSIGHLTIALQDHKEDLTAHSPCVNTTAYAPPHHANAPLPWTHAWDASVMTNVQGQVGTSASVLQIETLDSVVPAADVSTELSSDPSTISDD
ncbi:uncharacterized protein F5147DRAFT_659368 [Suillus discolor]|uniref:Uncharacterized protein n=1 Tax=Suillus discolor TaxID=1912936 RepID=A0A9P7ESP5_9AGAM|nr:uncharacterized protein F5147DRAFT_659368 [Suillus discolor]KAG2085890.1 hypothetical protein F5147DRAFT_659368 [Suillus discolor]